MMKSMRNHRQSRTADDKCHGPLFGSAGRRRGAGARPEARARPDANGGVVRTRGECRRDCERRPAGQAQSKPLAAQTPDVDLCSWRTRSFALSWSVWSMSRIPSSSDGASRGAWRNSSRTSTPTGGRRWSPTRTSPPWPPRVCSPHSARGPRTSSSSPPGRPRKPARSRNASKTSSSPEDSGATP